MRAMLVAAALVLAIGCPNVAGAADAKLIGDWDGSIQVGAAKLRLILHVADTVTMDSPDQGATGLPGKLEDADGKLRASFRDGSAVIEGPLSDDGNTIDATLTQSGQSFPLRLVRRTVGASAPEPAVAVTALAEDEREVSIDGGRAPLYGTLQAARGGKPGPAVLILAGSGPTDRNGDSNLAGIIPGNLKQLARGLAQAGYASVRIDKRGIGKSAQALKSEAELRFGDYVDDAVAWAKFLRSQPGVTCVVILGHSEGAHIAALAAQKTSTCGVVEVSGLGRSFGEVLREQARSSGLASEQLKRWDDILSQLEQGRVVPDVPVTDAVFRPSVQPYLISELALDPARSLKDVNAPALIIQGDNDIQVSVADARKLAAARPDAQLLIVPRMNHVLKIAPTDRAGNIAVYRDPNAPIAPGVIDAITGFLAKVRP